jgi:hypothetical protein
MSAAPVGRDTLGPIAEGWNNNGLVAGTAARRRAHRAITVVLRLLSALEELCAVRPPVAARLGINARRWAGTSGSSTASRHDGPPGRVVS